MAWVLLSLWGSAFAADIYIPDDYPTIQEGIDAATTGSKVIVRDGTYLLTAALDFKGKAITLKSEKGNENCILDGQQQTRVVYFHSGETSKSVLSGFKIRNGQADKGGGILCDSSSPTISNCKIMANKAYRNAGGDQYSYGGGIYCNSGSPIISNCGLAVTPQKLTLRARVARPCRQLLWRWDILQGWLADHHQLYRERQQRFGMGICRFLLLRRGNILRCVFAKYCQLHL